MCSFGTLNVPCAILEEEKEGKKDEKKREGKKQIFFAFVNFWIAVITLNVCNDIKHIF